ncbi:MAG: hypothetical protein JXB85_08950 [Anaerolineales bacterium]|nr:hypothetical protein [Anaerolineales bacterium]
MRTLHLVSHTHWDREWYLPFQQFRLKLVHLIDGLLEILEADSRFQFFMLDGQTIVLDDYLQMRPEREDALRQLVRVGRLIIGPWHILPDEFLVSPEATIRNLLEGERTCRRFGPKMRVGYIPDPFGHIGQMPQILNGFGIVTAAFRRGLSDEPVELWWQAPNGARVFTAYLRDGYDNAASLPVQDHAQFIAEVGRLRENLAPHAAAPHLLLMHGTDHMEPPPGTSAAISACEGQLDGDVLVHSTLANYLTAVQGALLQAQIPTVVGELRDPKKHHLLPGVLSTRMWIKQRNHACENLLEKWVEPFSTFATLVTEGGGPRAEGGLRRPEGVIRQAWRLLMENHPHDSICGCSIDQVHEEMKVRFDQVDQIGEELTRQSLTTLAENVNTAGRAGGAALVVFNPCGHTRTDLVEATTQLPAKVGSFDLVDEDGTPLPCQTRGLGSREIINLSMTPKVLRASMASIHDGRVAGLVFQDLHIRREGDIVYVDAVLAEQGEPNRIAWQAAVEQVEAQATDPSIKQYQIRGVSAAATRIVFTAPEVPGLGLRTFWLRPHPAQDTAPQRTSPLIRALLPLVRFPLIEKLASRKPKDKPPYVIENEFLRAEAHKDGTLTLHDKRNGATCRGLNRFVDGGDCGDEYNYSPPAHDQLLPASFSGVRIQRGPVQQTLEVTLQLEIPTGLAPDRQRRAARTVTLPIVTRATLHSGVARLDLETTIDNQARDHRLRVHFPAPFAVQEADHDGHFEVVRRKVGVPESDETWIEQPRPEVPQRAFTSISDGTRGLMIANRGLPEVEVRQQPDGNSEIAITLLRCVDWLSRDDFVTRKAHAGPSLETPGGQMPGSWTFAYAVIPHAGTWRETFEQAYAFDLPLRAMATGIHSGLLAPRMAFVESSPRTFVVSAVKHTEDGRGWLVRGYNIGGEDIYATLKPWRRLRSPERCMLSEERIELLGLEANDSVAFKVKPHEIATVAFTE